MDRGDFLKLIGSQTGAADYIPVACLLRNGYGLAGYYNTPLNQDFDHTCVLVNARLVELAGHSANEPRGTIHSFNDFLEDIVTRLVQQHDFAAEAELDGEGHWGKSIPLTAVSYQDITIVYPVAQIGTLMRRVEEDQKKTPTFLDFQNKSIILKVLTTKLW